MLQFLTRIRLIWAWARPVFSDAATTFLSKALPIASQVILSYAQSKLTNGEKRDAAMTDIRTNLEKSQVPVDSSSLLDLAFSMAYRKLKEEGSL